MYISSDPTTLLISGVISLAFIIYAFYAKHENDKMEDWIYVNEELASLPFDNEEVEWVDIYGEEHEGVFIESERSFYAGPRQQTKALEVEKWRRIEP